MNFYQKIKLNKERTKILEILNDINLLKENYNYILNFLIQNKQKSSKTNKVYEVQKHLFNKIKYNYNDNKNIFNIYNEDSISNSDVFYAIDTAFNCYLYADSDIKDMSKKIFYHNFKTLEEKLNTQLKIIESVR